LSAEKGKGGKGGLYLQFHLKREEKKGVILTHKKKEKERRGKGGATSLAKKILRLREGKKKQETVYGLISMKGGRRDYVSSFQKNAALKRGKRGKRVFEKIYAKLMEKKEGKYSHFLCVERRTGGGEGKGGNCNLYAVLQGGKGGWKKGERHLLPI